MYGRAQQYAKEQRAPGVGTSAAVSGWEMDDCRGLWFVPTRTQGPVPELMVQPRRPDPMGASSPAAGHRTQRPTEEHVVLPVQMHLVHEALEGGQGGGRAFEQAGERNIPLRLGLDGRTADL